MMGSHSPSTHPGTTHRDVLEALWKRSIEKFLPFYNKHGARAMSHQATSTLSGEDMKGEEASGTKGRRSAGPIRKRGRVRGSMSDH